jgi:hypothetical protein
VIRRDDHAQAVAQRPLRQRDRGQLGHGADCRIRAQKFLSEGLDSVRTISYSPAHHEQKTPHTNETNEFKEGIEMLLSSPETRYTLIRLEAARRLAEAERRAIGRTARSTSTGARIELGRLLVRAGTALAGKPAIGTPVLGIQAAQPVRVPARPRVAHKKVHTVAGEC